MPLNNYFEACLRDDEGKIYETGKATISDSGNFIDFTGEFVPLMDIRTEASITKILNRVECRRYTGMVYLSSKARLRLSNIHDELIDGIELSYPLRTQMQGQAFGIVNSYSNKLMHKGELVQEVKTVPCTVFFISMNEIGFTISSHHHHMATQLLLNINEPVKLTDIEVVVNRRLAFDQNQTACYATIEAMPDETKSQLVAYLENKLALHP